MHLTVPLVGWQLNPLTLVLIIAAIVAYKLLMRKRYNLPPGPFALPLLGNAIQFYFMKEKMYKTFTHLYQKRYGPVFTVYFGPKRVVVINNIDLSIEATVKKSMEFGGRPHLASLDYMSMDRRDIVMADIGPSWKLHRKIAYQAMRNYAMGENLEKMVHESFETIAADLVKLEGPIDPGECIRHLIYNLICGLCWGTIYSKDDEEVKRTVTLNKNLGTKSFPTLPEDKLSILKYFPSAFRRRFHRVFDAFFDTVWKKLRQHQQTFDPDNIRDFIDDLLLVWQQAEKEEDPEVMKQLTDVHLFQTIIDILGAANDTTRLTISFCLYYMLQYPDIQQKVQFEIDSNIGSDRLPGIKDKEKLAYTEATLKEVMRINTVVPIGVPHATMVDTSLAGYDIPKDTMIIFNTYAIHMDPTYWDDPETFDPHRFLNPDGTLAPKPTSFFPFSAGRRSCLGEVIAKPELLMLFACFMQRFSISLPPGDELPPLLDTTKMVFTPR